MNKLVNSLMMLALLAGLAACATLAGPRDIELPLSKLQGGLDRRFPLHQRALELFEIDLSRPQLSMQPESGRVALSLDALVAPPFTRQSWRGNLMLSGRLYIDAARGAVLMAEPRVDRFVVDGVDEARQRQLGKVANLLMASVVNDVPLYHFKPEDLRYAGVQFVPTRITATPRGLIVSVEPAR
jgi:hypothetical protein